MADLTEALRQVVKAANRRTGPATGWFMFKGVVFSSNAAAAHAPRNDPSLSPAQVERVREEMLSMITAKARP